MGLGIWAPLSYLLFLGGSLFLFSKFYRKKQSDAVVYTPWFPPNKSRDLYVSLLSLTPPPPRPLIVAALLRRAMYAITQIIATRESKAALSLLLVKGQIGDELWERFLAAEKELESEIVEICEEAEIWATGYGKLIFGVAADMIAHEGIKKAFESIDQKRIDENAKLRASITNHIFTPLTHRTPSSLTLFPSNPISRITIPPSMPVPSIVPIPLTAPTAITPSDPPAKVTMVTPAGIRTIASTSRENVPPSSSVTQEDVVTPVEVKTALPEKSTETHGGEGDDADTHPTELSATMPDRISAPSSIKKKKNKKKKS